MNSRPPVLVTDVNPTGQDRSALNTVRGLALAGYRPVVAAASRRSLAAASRYVSEVVPVPPDLACTPAIQRELSRGDYLTVIPCSDVALVAMDAPGADLLDKTHLPQRAMEAGLEAPPSRTFSSAEELISAAAELEFPVAVKPARSTHYTTAGADRPEDLVAWRGRQGPFVVQPYLCHEVEDVTGVLWKGRMVAVSHQRYLRTWPVGGGDGAFLVTMPPRRDREEGVVRLLGDYEGIFQVQFMGPYVTDVNPRPFASLALSLSARVNYPGIWCDLLRGVERGIEHRPIRTRPGITYRWLDGDARAILARLRRGQMGLLDALSALRPRFGMARAILSFDDTHPALVRAWYLVTHTGPRDTKGRKAGR